MDGLVTKLRKIFVCIVLGLTGYMVYAQETVLDQFGLAAYTNNNGTRNWAGNWTEAGDGTTGATGGLVQITGGALRVGSSGSATGTTANIQRSVNLSGVNSATLTFSISQTGIDSSGDSVVIEVSSDGTTFITPVLDTFRNSGLGSETYTLPTSSFSSTTTIRFRVAEALESGEYFTVDNVQISFTSNAPGYKSVALTKDGDGSGTVTTGDTLTYTVQYKNIGTSSLSDFQITDTLPTNVTLESTPTVTGATVNTAYTGVSPNNTLLAASTTLTAGSVISVSIPVVVNAGYSGTFSNQASATATSFVASSTDNVDSTTTGLPSGITVPSGSLTQTQTTAISATTTTVVAASAGSAFTCDATFYQTRIVGSTGSQFSRVFTLDRSAVPYTQTTFGTAPNIVINGMGYNVLDNYLYAIYLGPEGSSTNGTTSSLALYRIGQGGFQSLGPISGLPVNFAPTAADFDGSGNFYLTRAGGSTELYRINVTTRTATLITMATTPNLADMSFNPTDNFLYAVNNSPQELYRINPTTGAWTITSITGVSSGEGAWGTTFFDKAGTFYAYGNEGSFYTINLTTGVATRLSSADSATRSDGASCVFPPPTVDVVKSVGTVTTVNSTTADVPYTIVIGNKGSTTANNVQVTENLGLTFSAGSPTISITTGPIVTSGTCTANNSATGLPQFDGVDNGNSGELALLEGTNSLAANASCTITFTARVMYPSAASVPTTAQNNSVYASSSSITNRGHTFPATGVILPPPNLLAFDTSTNVSNPAAAASLPATSNADTASVTPVIFGGTVTGTLYLDNNSNSSFDGTPTDTRLGANISVELVDSSNTVVATQQTTSTGDYTFNNVAAGSYTVRVVTTDPDLGGAVASAPASAQLSVTVTPLGTLANQHVGFIKTDYGDAPLSYGTPSHTNSVQIIYLGSVAPDGDAGHAYNGTVTATNASDDDTNDTTVTSGTSSDDEDGVATFPTLNAVAGQTYTVSVNVTNASGSNAFLVGYLDFNRDGDFADPGELSSTVTVASSATNPQAASVSFTTPAGIIAGTSYARFRLSGTQAQVESPTLTASSGEVEDYTLTIIATDYGDAPDTATATATGNYRTLASDNGPSHTIVTGLAIGPSVDADLGMAQNAAADADGADEDGVSSFPSLLTTSAAYTVIVNVTNSTGSDAYLMAYLDRNRDGDFLDANEFPTTPVTIPSSTTNPRSFTITIPAATSAAGTSYMRFRLSSTSAQASSSVGASTSGEVEDYRVSIGVDYGDAPDTAAGTGTGNYQTLASDGGASHQIVTGLTLGSSIDSDSGALQNATATLDDTTNNGSADDEEAVSSFPALATTATSYSVSVNASNNTGSDAYLVGYLDFNRDGDFADTGERSATVTVASDTTTNPRSFTVNFTGLSGGSAGISYTRLRLSQTQTQAETSVGAASSGEVEDYRINVGVDYGDAPDTGTGTATGNYQTLASDGGPSHQFVANLALGSSVDSETGTLQDAAATADDLNGSDDEDATSTFSTLTSSASTYGLTVTATNNTGSNAFLVGYIDFNRDGDFADTGERSATVTVGSSGTNPRSFSLSFSGLTGGSAGSSYVRLRLSNTQTEAENSLGAATSGEVEDHQLTISPPLSTELSITKTAPASVELGRSLTYTLQIANAGPDGASGIVIADTLPSTFRSSQWTCAVSTGTADCNTLTTGTSSSGSGNISLSNVQMNAGSSLTITITGIASTTATLSNTATVRPPSGVTDTGYNASTNTFSGNNTSSTTTSVTTPTYTPPTLPSVTTAGVCAVPGTNGDGTLSGVINTYYGSASNNQTASAGSTSVVLGASRGAGTPIAVGDLILFIQMQDATINTSDTANYGGNNGTGSSYTSLDSTGLYEYVVATNSVPLTGGTLTFTGGGTGGGLVNTYTNADPSASRGQRTFQVIRVPQYANATISGTLQAVKWDGDSGGVVVVDVAGTLTWSGTIDVELSGFRAGYAPAAASGNSSGTVYRCSAKTTCGAGKGEGVAGTPANLWDGTSAITTGSGYPDGTTYGADYGMGAPASGGGGGGFHNAGGGGGSNGGAGGKGGLGWEGQSTTNDGGEPGVPLPPAINRLFMGGGGGGGDANNAASGVRGGVGAGIVLVRAGVMTGTGTVEADGDNGDKGVYQSAPDGAGGGGAGGSVLLYAKNSSSVTLTVNARGGPGGNTENDNNNEHGPGGGGGGGLVVHSVPGGTVTTNLTGGLAGRANNGAGIVHGAQDGTPGHALTFTTTNDPFANGGDGSTCAPQLSVTKTTTTPTRALTDTTATYTITVTNATGKGTGRGIAITDDLPSPFTYAGSAVTPVYAGGATGPASVTGTGTDPVTFGTAGGDTTNSFTIPAGGSVALTFDVNLNSATTATYQNPATVFYTDPTSATATITPSGTDSLGQSVPGSNYASASSSNEDVTLGSSSSIVGLAKSLERIVHSNNATDNSYTLVYRLTLENFSSTQTLSNLELYDDVVSQFSGLNPTNFNAWLGQGSPANSTTLSPAPTLTLDSSWNGTASSNILTTGQSLVAGATGIVYISFGVTVNPVATSPNNQLRDNSAAVESGSLTDTSTNGTDPDGSDNDNNPDESTQTPAPFVKLIKEVRNCGSSLSSCSGSYGVSATGKPGEYLEYRIRYYNISSQAISTLVVNDTLVSTTPFQEDTYSLLPPSGVADFSVTCPASSTVDLDRSNSAVTTTPGSGAITAFSLNVVAATVCNLTTITPGEQGQVLFKVKIP